MIITLLISFKTLVLRPSIFILELLLATRQLKTLEILFTKVQLKIFEPFLFKWSLLLLDDSVLSSLNDQLGTYFFLDTTGIKFD